MNNDLQVKEVIDLIVTENNKVLQKQLIEKYQHQNTVINELKEDGLNCFTRGPNGVANFFIKNVKDTIVTILTSKGYIIYQWCPVDKRWNYIRPVQLYNTMIVILPKLMLEVAEKINTLSIYSDDNKKQIQIAESYYNIKKCKKLKTLLFLGLVQEDFLNKLNKIKMVVPIQDGIVYDFNTYVVRERLNTDYYTKTLKATYDQNAKSDVLDKFLDDFTLGRQELKDFLQEISGTTLTGYNTINNTINKIVVNFHGYTGNNGKSLFIGLLQKLLGSFSFNCDKSVIIKTKKNDIQTILNTNWLCIVQCLNKNEIICSNKLKYWLYNIESRAYLMLVSNEKILVEDIATSCTRDKLIYFPCDCVAVENPIHTYQRKYDEYLKDKLEQPEVLNALLIWLIEGANRVLERGYIYIPNNLKNYN